MQTTRTNGSRADGDPWPVALRILTRRDCSRTELRRRLLDKGFNAARVEEVLQRCHELGYLDDARYALNRATGLMDRGRAVGPRILVDLRRRGISEEVARTALDLAREARDEGELLATLVQRRFPGFDYASAPAGEKRRVVHFLQRRGFPLDRIMNQLTEKGFTTDDEDR